MKILAISGSLRARSSNTEVLRALSLVTEHEVIMYDRLGELPHFNPDLDDEGATAPLAVEELRRLVADADRVVICTPEYAHGVPGSLKNALDWLVSSPAMVGKEVTIINASSRSTFASASLAETLRTMSATLVPDGPRLVPMDGRRMTASQIASDRDIADALRSAVADAT